MKNKEIVVIDLDATIQVLETREMALECLGEVFDAIAGYKSKFNDAHTASDIEKLRAQAHIMKGILACCSLPAMKSALTPYHELLRDENSDDAQRREAHDALMVEMDRFVEYYPKFKAENEE